MQSDQSTGLAFPHSCCLDLSLTCRHHLQIGSSDGDLALCACLGGPAGLKTRYTSPALSYAATGQRRLSDRRQQESAVATCKQGFLPSNFGPGIHTLTPRRKLSTLYFSPLGSRACLTLLNRGRIEGRTLIQQVATINQACILCARLRNRGLREPLISDPNDPYLTFRLSEVHCCANIYSYELAVSKLAASWEPHFTGILLLSTMS